MGDKEYHERRIGTEQRKLHPGNNDGYVPHLEKGDGGGHARQSVKLWQHAQGQGCYDTSAHSGDRHCLGEADGFRRMHHAHINTGTHSFHGATKQGHLRNSGVKGADRIGQRKR